MPRLLKFAVLFLFALLIAPGSSFAEIDGYFNQEVAKGHSPSISLAIVKDGKIVYAKAYGYADLENDVVATPESVYRLGSITKQFTATMIMQLVNEKSLTLDEPVRQVLPDTPAAWSQVTVRNLLNHTSGIKSYTELPDMFSDRAMKPTPPQGIIDTIAKYPLDFPAGSKMHYDNTGYEVLGMIIEKLDHRSYEQSLKIRILTPLGMTHTYFTSERAIVKHRVQGYSKEGSGFQHAPYLNMDWPYAAGSMESTTLDLAKWDAALYGSSILPQSSLKQMWTKTTFPDGKTEDYGFGWQLLSQNNVPVVGHGGGIHGFTTFIERVPSLRETAIVLSNSDSADSEGFARKALELYDSRLKPELPKGIPDDAPAETAFATATVRSVLAGKVDRKTMTPEFNKLITPEMEKQVASQLSSLGALSKLVLISSTVKDGAKTRIYQAFIGTRIFTITFVLDKSGLISGLSFQ